MSPTFADLGVPEPIVEALAERGITEPFPIQQATIKDALSGRDICGRAPTGSGKTLAFGIPIVAQVKKSEPRQPRALILAPTRELANQITQELVPLARPRKRFVEAVYGGVNIDRQIKSLRKGVDILVACPGRLEDLISRGSVSLESVRFVVIDEADRMADMGFLPPVRRLLDQCHAKRQTLLFSATLDGDIAKLTAEYQKNPVRHEVGSAEPDITRMKHLFWNVTREDRLDVTARAIGQAGPTIVFVRTKHGADRIARQLKGEGVSAVAIHGNRSQNQRERALREFDRGEARALVATDVAARGVHVDGVACVIHFDPPNDHKDYVHRSGRTARAGAEGVVISLLQRNQHKDAKKMQRQLGLDVAVTEPGSHTFALPPSRKKKAPARSKAAGSGQRGTSADRAKSPRSEQQRQTETPRRKDTSSATSRRTVGEESAVAGGRYAQRLAETAKVPEYGGSETTPGPKRNKKRKRDEGSRKNLGAPKRLREGGSPSGRGEKADGGTSRSGKATKPSGGSGKRTGGKAKAKNQRTKPTSRPKSPASRGGSKGAPKRGGAPKGRGRKP